MTGIPAIKAAPCVFSGACRETLSFPAAPPTYTFLFPESGSAQAQLDGQTLLCPAGSYLYLPSGSEARLTVNASRLILLRIPDEHIPCLLHFGMAAVYREPSAADLFRTLAESAEGAGPASSIRMHAGLLRLYAMHDTCAADDAKIRIAPGAALLELEFLRSEPISRYAEASSMGETSFRTLFIHCYGLSPVEYRIKLRLERARTLITVGRLSVQTAAKASGFHSVSYFCRLYKQAYGHSPGAGEEDENA